MRSLARLRREARLEVTLRLSPQLALHAQASERQQQLCFARTLAQPFFRALEPLERVLVNAFAVKEGERPVPIALERFLDDPVRPATIPEPNEGARSRGRNLGME